MFLGIIPRKYSFGILALLVLAFTLHAVAGEKRAPSSQPSLSPDTLGVDEDFNQHLRVEAKQRQELIRNENCPLILFFAPTFAGEAVVGQSEKIPEDCKKNYEAWRKAVVDTEQMALIPPREKTEIEREENFDDTANGRIRIDADGLAWYYEFEPERVEEVPATFVVVEERGNSYELVDAKESSKVTHTAHWKRSLLPQYSNLNSLSRYKSSIGTRLDAEVPMIDAPNAEGSTRTLASDPASGEAENK